MRLKIHGDTYRPNNRECRYCRQAGRDQGPISLAVHGNRQAGVIRAARCSALHRPDSGIEIMGPQRGITIASRSEKISMVTSGIHFSPWSSVLQVLTGPRGEPRPANLKSR